MSKPVKQLIRKELTQRLEGIDSLAVVGFTGLNAVLNHQIRARLLEKNIRLTVVKNSLARQALTDVGLPQAGSVLNGPCALAVGGDSVVDVVRELLAIGKEAPALTVKGAVLDGEVFETDRVVELSKYPTREEALGIVVSCVLSPASNISGCLKGPSGKIAGILKTIEERHGEEQGEEAEAA
jgi:large subunit ribosomal protein L10